MVVVDPADYPRVLRARWRARRPVARVQVRADEESVRAHRGVRRADCADARDDRLQRRQFRPGAAGPAGRSRRRRPSATARTRIRRRSGRRAGRRHRARWDVHQGKELSYTNLLDLDAALRIALEFTEPAAVVIKHTNPCGVATGATIAEAYVRGARSRSALGVRRHRRAESSRSTRTPRRAITSTFIEAVIAPSIADEAREILAKKTNMRVVTADFDAAARAWQSSRDDASIPRRTADARTRIGSTEAREPWSAWPGSATFGLTSRVVTQAAADAGGVDGAALRVARLRAREVEHDRLHRAIARWRSAPGR